MARPEGKHTEPRVIHHPDAKHKVEKGHPCTCPAWPCTLDTCSGCRACIRHGQPFYTVAEETWLETGKGLPAAEVEQLHKIGKNHGSRGANSRATRRSA